MCVSAPSIPPLRSLSSLLTDRSSASADTVVSVTPPAVVLEMSSKLEPEGEWNAHHRMTVALSAPLSMAGLDGVRPRAGLSWNLQSFDFKDQDGEWQQASHRWNTQAFEEKFDVHAMLPALPLPISVLQSCVRHVPALSTRATLFRSRRLRHTNAWYIREPTALSGLAAFKAFGPREAAPSYTFQLIGFGDASGDTAAIDEEATAAGERDAATSAHADSASDAASTSADAAHGAPTRPDRLASDGAPMPGVSVAAGCFLSGLRKESL
jgi:hypothetical protein